MIITIRNPHVLRFFGWKIAPSYCTAHIGLWFHWFKQEWLS